MFSRTQRDSTPRGRRVFLLQVLFLSLSLYLVSPPFVSASILSGKILKVLDGDTFLIRVQGQEEHVRLREIDAPEITHRKKAGQEPWGRKARDFAQSLVRGKTVRLEVEEPDERDKYRRLLAYVFLDPIFVNSELILSGNAFFYPGPFRGKYAESSRKQKKRPGKRAVESGTRGTASGSPLTFAAARRGTRVFSPDFGAHSGEGKKSAPKEYAVPPDKIVGNKRSMIYHLPGGREAARVNPKNRVLFDSPEEAEKAGFRRARPAPQKSSRTARKF